MSLQQLNVLLDVVETSSGVVLVAAKEEDLLAQVLAEGAGAGDGGSPL